MSDDSPTPRRSTVSRRLRFEILRRDGHTCRYCGASAPDVPLTVDHVIPVTLGGGDEPSNLVTACQDCNAGKSSIAPDSAIVEDVDATAMMFGKAVERAAEIRRQEIANLEEILGWFYGEWTEAAGDPPQGWHNSVEGYLLGGLTPDDLRHYMNVAFTSRVMPKKMFPYFCGCCRNEVARRQELARCLIEDGEV